MTDPALLHLVRSAVRPLRSYAAPSESAPIKLDANECTWPLPEEARARIAEILSNVEYHRYPDATASAVRERLAGRLGCSKDTLLVGTGSDELIAVLMTSLCEPRRPGSPTAVLYPTPTFVMYGMTATTHGLSPIEVPLDPSWALDTEAMVSAIERHKPNLVFLASPNNPTGNAFRDEDVSAVIEADPEALVLLDEAYGAFAGRSLGWFCDRYPNVGLLGTLSKVGMAAIRLGWCRLPEALAVEAEKARQPYNTSTLTQYVAELALGELAPVLDDMVARVIQERTRLFDALSKFEELTPCPTDANFILVRCQCDPDELRQRLLSSGISIKSFGAQGALAGHVRLTVGTPGENDSLLGALEVAFRTTG